MKSKLKTKLAVLAAVFATILAATPQTMPAHASTYSVSPMYQMISLTPGETYVGNFEIVNPGDNVYNFYYQLRVEPYSVDEANSPQLEANGDYSHIVDWIELSNPTGVIAPNEHAEARFVIDVPENAPAGGQYASIVVSSGEYRVDNSDVDLREVYETAHILYADIAGETVRKGTITDISVPSFLLSGQITGSATINNEGNVHSEAVQTMQIFPLFSNEEVYTNEEDPKKTWIMPERSIFTSVKWDGAPSLGVFHVIYNVEYEGVKANVDKIVIVCPIWLLFILIACLFIVLFAIIFGEKKEKK
ncbi:hypothetical protein IJ095_00125 [Candidatus Saccharibacteria bacterium]|nr:hypothetical protein [Candidatus Saccharibacteria bacterium]